MQIVKRGTKGKRGVFRKERRRRPARYRYLCVMVYYTVLFLMFFWCPCMAINVNVQYNGGFLLDIILLTRCYLHRGTCLNAMKRFFVFAAFDPT